MCVALYQKSKAKQRGNDDQDICVMIDLSAAELFGVVAGLAHTVAGKLKIEKQGCNDHNAGKCLKRKRFWQAFAQFRIRGGTDQLFPLDTDRVIRQQNCTDDNQDIPL